MFVLLSLDVQRSLVPSRLFYTRFCSENRPWYGISYCLLEYPLLGYPYSFIELEIPLPS